MAPTRQPGRAGEGQGPRALRAAPLGARATPERPAQSFL